MYKYELLVYSRFVTTVYMVSHQQQTQSRTEENVPLTCYIIMMWHDMEIVP